MLNSLVFHEAFDSTRTADSESAPNLAQAQAEALVSLLLGHSLALTNTYAFDSRGVLDLSRAVLSARDDIQETVRPGSTAHRRLQRASPFMLSWWNAASFFSACAGQLRNIDSENLDDRFLLSAWGPIDLDPVRRNDLADTLESGSDPRPPVWLHQYPGLPDQFDALTAINRFARHYGRGRPASKENAVDLLDYVTHFHTLGAEGQLRALAAKGGCPEDVAVELWERIDTQLKQKDSQKVLSRRSWIHVAVAVAKENHDSNTGILEQVKELVDTFYNARLAQSGYADHDFLSSVPRSSATRELKYVNDLAVNVISHRRPGVGRPPLQGMFTAPADEPSLDVAPLRQLFRAYWEIVGDDDRCRTWRQSCDTVNRLLRKRPAGPAPELAVEARTGYSDWRMRFKDAWADHMALLRREIPEVVRTDDRGIQVTVPEGGEIYQGSLQFTGERTGTLSQEELDTALATGRYVSNLETWVNV